MEKKATKELNEIKLKNKNININDDNVSANNIVNVSRNNASEIQNNNNSNNTNFLKKFMKNKKLKEIAL